MTNKLFNVQDWKYHCQTDAGFLLSSDVSTFENEIYVNDKKISSLIFPDSSLHLTYSYNFTNYVGDNLNNDGALNINVFNDLIVKIFNDLPDENKQFFYQSIFNHSNSYEWSIDSLKEIIVSFFININPNKYLIADENIHSNYTIINLAKTLHYVIISLPTNIYQKLINEYPDLSLESWWQKSNLNYLNNRVNIAELNLSGEQVNYEYLIKFVNNIIQTNSKIQSLLTELNVQIISNLPVAVLYIPKDKIIYISKSALLNKEDTAKRIFIALFKQKLQELYTVQQFKSFWNSAINLMPLIENFDNEDADPKTNAIEVQDNEQENNQELDQQQIANLFFNLISKIVTEYHLSKGKVTYLLKNCIVAVLKSKTSDCEFNVDLNENENTLVVNKQVIVVSNEEYDDATNKNNKVSLSEVIDEIDDIKVGDVVNEEIDLNDTELLKEIVQLFDKKAKENCTLNHSNSVEPNDSLIGKVIEGTIETIDLQKGIAFVSFDDKKGIIFNSQEIPNEKLIKGYPYKFYVEDKNNLNHEYPYILSRSNEELVSQLFSQMVPQLKDGVIEITGIARNPGIDTKLLVKSNNPDLNPVALCCGENKEILHTIEDLIFIPSEDNAKKERINVIGYDDNPMVLIANVCKPIKIVGVEIENQSDKKAYVVAHPKDLAVLIGTQGNNIKLIHKLIGWSIKVITQNEALEKDISYSPINIKPSFNQEQNFHYDEELNKENLTIKDADYLIQEDNNQSSENDELVDASDFIDNQENNQVVTDFKQLNQINNFSAEEYSTSTDKQNSISTNSLKQQDFNDNDYKETLNSQSNLQQNNANKYLSTDDEMLHFDQPLFAVNKIVQVYCTSDKQVSLEVPPFLKWLIDSWPWNFADDEFKKLDFGNVPLDLAFFNDDELVFNITVSNWSNTSTKTINCQLFSEEVTSIDWKMSIERLSEQKVNLNYWNDFLYVIIVSLDAIEKNLKTNSKKNKVINFNCQITIGNFISVMVDSSGAAHSFQLGKANSHPISSWNDILLSMLNLAAVPLKQIPFADEHLHYFLQECKTTNIIKPDWIIISDMRSLCYLKLEFNWIKILIRAIIFLKVFNKCDFK